jgi:hypothetical protein
MAIGTNNSIDNFKAFYSGGFQSPTKYRVETTPPGGSAVEWYPDSITLPSRSFQVFTDTIYGTHKQFPYRQQFNDEIVMTLNLSQNNAERNYFENWMNGIVGFNNVPNLDMIKIREHSLVIFTTTPDSTAVTGTYAVFGAYPSSIIPSNFSYGMQNEVAKLQVTFNYYKYYYYA